METPATTMSASVGEQAPAESVAIGLFELAPAAVEIVLRLQSAQGRYELKHRLRPPTLEDWTDYERNLKSSVVASDQAPDALEFGSASLEAAVALYDRLFLEAEGYCVSTCERVTCSQIPVHHKEMAIRALGDVGPASEPVEDGNEKNLSPFELDPERVTVKLQASAHGNCYTELTHSFALPTAADRIAYSRIVSQALYVRGSRSFKTLLPVRLPALVKLYDQLVSEVSGYSVQGQAVLERAAIIRHMSPLHKKAAVQELFER